ncbi:hypothetical protein BAY59_10965 [Prauserella coralliicola]|nr:hypothetical protein BAY59_10965 [Prauserella coralliicola]
MTERMAYSVKEAAQLLGVKEKTVRWLIHNDQLEYVMVSRYYRIPHTALEKLLKRSKGGSQAPSLRAV